jgi:hypothetical protein
MGPTASPYGSSHHWSSSTYAQQSLEFNMGDMADSNEAQRPSSPSIQQYHQTGIVSPVGSDTSSDPNIIISPVSSVSSSIDQLLLDSKEHAGTIHASLRYEHLPHFGGKFFPPAPSQADQLALIDQTILDPTPVSGLGKCPSNPHNLEDENTGASQQLLVHAISDKEQ